MFLRVRVTSSLKDSTFRGLTPPDWALYSGIQLQYRWEGTDDWRNYKVDSTSESDASSEYQRSWLLTTYELNDNVLYPSSNREPRSTITVLAAKSGAGSTASGLHASDGRD